MKSYKEFVAEAVHTKRFSVDWAKVKSGDAAVSTPHSKDDEHVHVHYYPDVKSSNKKVPVKVPHAEWSANSGHARTLGEEKSLDEAANHHDWQVGDHVHSIYDGKGNTTNIHHGKITKVSKSRFHVAWHDGKVTNHNSARGDDVYTGKRVHHNVFPGGGEKPTGKAYAAHHASQGVKTVHHGASD